MKYKSIILSKFSFNFPINIRHPWLFINKKRKNDFSNSTSKHSSLIYSVQSQKQQTTGRHIPFINRQFNKKLLLLTSILLLPFQISFDPHNIALWFIIIIYNFSFNINQWHIVRHVKCCIYINCKTIVFYVKETSCWILFFLVYNK